MAVRIYDTFIVSEILKSYYNAGKEPDLYFFRNTDGQEVDLLFYRDGKLYPIEIKKTSSPNVKDAKRFGTLSTFFPSLEVSEGGIICNAEYLLPLGQKLKIIPLAVYLAYPQRLAFCGALIACIVAVSFPNTFPLIRF